MKAIDKSRFKPFLSTEEEALADAAGAIREDERRTSGNVMKPLAVRARAATR
jgi:hypothetical protein